MLVNTELLSAVLLQDKHYDNGITSISLTKSELAKWSKKFNIMYTKEQTVQSFNRLVQCIGIGFSKPCKFYHFSQEDSFLKEREGSQPSE